MNHQLKDKKLEDIEITSKYIISQKLTLDDSSEDFKKALDTLNPTKEVKQKYIEYLKKVKDKL